MKKSEKKMIIENFEEKCDCREDDNCGCSFPNNTRPEPEAEAVGETKGSCPVPPPAIIILPAKNAALRERPDSRNRRPSLPAGKRNP